MTTVVLTAVNAVVPNKWWNWFDHFQQSEATNSLFGIRAFTADIAADDPDMPSEVSGSRSTVIQNSNPDQIAMNAPCRSG